MNKNTIKEDEDWRGEKVSKHKKERHACFKTREIKKEIFSMKKWNGGKGKNGRAGTTTNMNSSKMYGIWIFDKR